MNEQATTEWLPAPPFVWWCGWAPQQWMQDGICLPAVENRVTPSSISCSTALGVFFFFYIIILPLLFFVKYWHDRPPNPQRRGEKCGEEENEAEENIWSREWQNEEGDGKTTAGSLGLFHIGHMLHCILSYDLKMYTSQNGPCLLLPVSFNFMHPYNFSPRIKRLSSFHITVNMLKHRDQQQLVSAALVWDLLVCSQLSEPGRLAGRGKLPSLTILLTFTLQSQLFKAACTSTLCQPAPAVKSGSRNLKAHTDLIHYAWHAAAAAAVCVCAILFVAVKSREAAQEHISVNQKTFVITFFATALHSLNARLSYSFPLGFPWEIKNI